MNQLKSQVGINQTLKPSCRPSQAAVENFTMIMKQTQDESKEVEKEIED